MSTEGDKRLTSKDLLRKVAKLTIRATWATGGFLVINGIRSDADAIKHPYPPPGSYTTTQLTAWQNRHDTEFYDGIGEVVGGVAVILGGELLASFITPIPGENNEPPPPKTKEPIPREPIPFDIKKAS